MSQSTIDRRHLVPGDAGRSVLLEPQPQPLCDFARLMLAWNEHQAFHVNDVVELAQPVDVVRLQAAAEAELAAAGVAWPIPDARNGTVSYADLPVSVPVQVIHPGERNLRECLDAQCSTELTRRFVPGTDSFLRLWVMRSAPGDYLGMTWQHWPCDGYAAGDLLRRILGRYLGLPVPRETCIASRETPALDAVFAPWRTWRHRLHQLQKGLHEIVKLSRAFKAPRPADPATPLRTTFLDLPHDVLARIQQAAGRNDATVNDVVCAAVLRALSDTIPAGHWWRRRTSVSNIVDLRQLAPEQLGNRWGMFLAFCVFNCMKPPASQDELIRHVRQQSQRTKASKSYFASFNAMRVSRRLWPWLPGRWRWTMSRKLGTFSAVLSNLRMPPSWFPAPWHEHVKGWWRTLPQGATVPFSVGVTTFGTRLTMTLTTEQSSYLWERLDGVKATLRENLLQG